MEAWQRSTRTPPTDPGLVAEAAANPGGSVAVIDSELVGGNANGYVPGEAVHGCWIVGSDGILTGEYAENPKSGTPTDDFAKLTAMDHYWGWLPDEPAAAVRASIADVLTEGYADDPELGGKLVDELRSNFLPALGLMGAPQISPDATLDSGKVDKSLA